MLYKYFLGVMHMKNKFLLLTSAVILAATPTVNSFAAPKQIDKSTKINQNISELGFEIDNSVAPENYVLKYSYDNKNYILPYCVLENNVLTFRAPQTASYDLINNTKQFSDVKNSSDISFVAARELFSGVDKNTFAPDAYMTRAMFLQVLARLDNADLSAYGKPNFADVDENAWYAPAISWASSNNLVISRENSLLFKPNEPITREDVASILYRYAQNKNFLLWQPGLAVARPPFTDLDKISDYARDAVTKLNWAGVLSAKSENNFEPTASSTRSEIASVLKNFIERMTQVN